MHRLRLFIVVLQELEIIVYEASPGFVALHFLVSEIAKCIACLQELHRLLQCLPS